MNIRERVSELHRNLVVSYDEGERLGHVTNTYFEKSSCSIRGLSLSPGFIKSDQEKFASFKSIHRLGKSVVIISAQKELTNIPQKLEGGSLRELKGTKVVTQEGEHLGELLDVNVYAKSGIISDIILYGAKKLRIDVKKDGISIGPDMIIVPANYRTRIKDIEVTNQDRFVASAGKTTRTVTQSIKTAVRNITAANKKAQEKAVEKNGRQAKDEAEKKPDPIQATSEKKPVTTAVSSTKPAANKSPETLPTKRSPKQIIRKAASRKSRSKRKPVLN